jgi:hypothetical protein
MRRFGSLFLVLALLAVGCGDEPSPATDAGTDAFVAPPVDAGGSEPDGGPMGCDVSPLPDPLGEFVGTFAVLGDADGGTELPVATGGDLTGMWVIESATFFVGPAAAEMFDEEASRVNGTAWLAFDGEEMRLDYRFVTTLEGTLAGTILRPTSTQIRGGYTLDDARIVVTPTCVAPPPTSGGSAGLQFSVEGDQGTFISSISGASGNITIVLQGTRRAL